MGAWDPHCSTKQDRAMAKRWQSHWGHLQWWTCLGKKPYTSYQQEDYLIVLGPRQLKIIGQVNSELGLVDLYKWVSSRPIFDTSTSHMRQLSSIVHAPPMHNSLTRQARRTRWEPDPRKVWKKICCPFVSKREHGYVMWQIIYLFPMTNSWRHREVPRSNLVTSPTTYTKIQLIAYGTTPSRSRFWESWACNMIQHTIGHQHRDVKLTLPQALLRDNLRAHRDTPGKWWELIQGAIYWVFRRPTIQLLTMEHLETMAQALLDQIWHRIKVYMYKEWAVLQNKVNSNRIQARVAKNFFCYGLWVGQASI